MEEINVTTPYGSWIMPLHRHITILVGHNASGKTTILLDLAKTLYLSNYVNFEYRGRKGNHSVGSWAMNEWYEVRRDWPTDASKLIKAIQLMLLASPYDIDPLNGWVYNKEEAIGFEELHPPLKHIIGLYTAAYRMQMDYKEGTGLDRYTFIIDQPTLGLDITRAKKVIKDLMAIAPDIRFVFSTHDPAFIDDVNWDYVVDVTKLKPVTYG
jgi:hypothetical protein